MDLYSVLKIFHYLIIGLLKFKINFLNLKISRLLMFEMLQIRKIFKKLRNRILRILIASIVPTQKIQ